MKDDLRQRIINHLTTKGNYDPNIDDDNIDDLIELTELTKQTLKTLKKEGVVTYYTTTSGSRVSKLNPLLNAYQMMKRDVFQMTSKLGISRSDRMKLKILEIKAEDGFDQLMND